MRKGFTLIEMLISVVILSIMMIFLYQSYASLNRSNIFYKEKTDAISIEQIKKRVMYLDFSLALNKSITILNQEKNEDVVFMQTSNSIHKRLNPYVSYIVNDEKLYRLESLDKILEYPLGNEDQYISDYFGDVDDFRVYKSTQQDANSSSEIYLLHVNYKEEKDVILKVKVLNDY